jgi:hypothetical protein
MEVRRQKAEGGRRKAEGKAAFSIFHFPFVICYLSFVWRR